ncbi:uncharacterized protein BO80DRAFT_117272 [Aspergillus ibericus CBS 121593]|uniref:Uncharacterized protein n=1 Tax=Aspergillus ibericus CBS 121593 TaxID=1448316 RepID=A0A395GWD8_9EURO|nr:hypothetical protein BO80DRAFT_117272 [Aspergillus ibericus CBS 121593]RAK99856.1 hypothetical protein BO80DRAFT_117272 [Aspergillus ibericus CBS 121593]
MRGGFESIALDFRGPSRAGFRPRRLQNCRLYEPRMLGALSLKSSGLCSMLQLGCVTCISDGLPCCTYQPGPIRLTMTPFPPATSSLQGLLVVKSLVLFLCILLEYLSHLCHLSRVKISRSH